MQSLIDRGGWNGVGPGSAGALRLLVVDDQAAVLHVLNRLFVAGGYEVDTAADGEQAIERLRGGGYDAVVTDLMMPVLDGVRLIEWIRHESDSSLPVIVFSGYQNERLAAYLTSLNVPAILPKPLGMYRLLDTLAQLLRQPAIAGCN